jgi:hypothetical protein
MRESLLKVLNKREKQIAAGTHALVEVPIKPGEPRQVDFTGREFQDAVVKITKPRKEYKHMTKAERESKKRAQEKQPAMFGEAATVAEKDQQTKEVTVENNTLTERFMKAWSADLLAVSNKIVAENGVKKATDALADADGKSAKSALAVGRVLIEIKQAALHGGLTKFMETIPDYSESVRNRCNYCISVARQTDGDEREAEKKAALAALAEKAEAAKKAIAHAEAEKTHVPPGGKLAKKQDVLIARQQKVVELLNKVTTEQENKRVEEIAEKKITEKRSALYGEVDKIAQRLKNIVKAAADDRQPELDFSGADALKTELKAEIDSLVSDVLKLAKEAHQSIDAVSVSESASETSEQVTATSEPTMATA